MRSKETEEFVQMVLKKAKAPDEETKPHKRELPDNEEVENLTKSLHASFADKKKH